jgi:hypothetical protein
MIGWSPPGAAHSILERGNASLDANIPWSSIIKGIRLYAQRQSIEFAEELSEWANLLESLEMQRTRNR